MTLAGFAAYSGALAVAAAIPGPGIVALVARSLGSGFRNALPMALGLVLGDLFYLTAAVLGLAFIAQTFGALFTVVKYVGAAYLLYLAWRLWRSEPRPVAASAARPDQPGAAFAAGLIVTLGNPKVMVFYLALLPTLLDLTSVTPGDYAILAGLTLAVLMAVLTPYLALAARARGLLQAPRALKALNRTAAGFMAGAAAAIAVRS